ncbi:integrin beta-1-like [Amphiura filiformis]|uniref:integrin beta-1-like n=1 Tax=Amphiura filiformis TaxID=82378 RepID=UPI003B20CE03
MTRWLGTAVCILFTIYTTTYSQSDSNTCNTAKTCGECIVKDASCGWCTQDNYTATGAARCDLAESLQKRGCAPSQITNPKSDTTIIKNVPLSNAGSNASNIVQVKPQEIRLTLRPGEVETVIMQVRQAEDYPVDLYYVMDLSKSMEDDLRNLKLLGATLAREMKQITSNFQLGFGSFVDKTVMPYVSTVPSKLQAPCDGCEPPYGFKNILPLDPNTNKFTEKVSMQRASGNLDAPEGGMDALMQITVCQNEIGWREQARHLVIYTTDSSFHYAGDGKLGGIVTPNDGGCHLDPFSMNYTMSHSLDYPSISQLNTKMRENSIIPIFAVTSSEYEVYSNLTEYIEGATAAELAADSSNIVQLLKTNYAKITSKVELKDTAPENITIAYTAYCNGTVTPGSAICEGLQLGDTVNFSLAITAQNCLSTPQRFTVSPVGFSEELVIWVETVCNCACETTGVPNSEKCTRGNGTLECGACICNSGRYGKECECSSNDANLEDNDATCRAGNSSIVCSGRGNCVCGECVCHGRPNPEEIVSGTYCECDNFSCDRYKGELCGGEQRGTCVCDEKTKQSKCICKPDFTGDACECSTRKDTCRAANGLECNGFGTCVCGECKCNTSTPYRGQRCEECPACPGQCIVNRDCVQCKAFGTGLSEEECNSCPHPVQIVDDLKIPNGSERCLFQDTDDCSFIFTYQTLANGTFVLMVQAAKVCPEAVDPLYIILGIVIGIIIIGLILLLIWRLLTYIHDKREFARFEKERQNAKWEQSQNPIYKPSTSTYKNPLYGK